MALIAKEYANGVFNESTGLVKFRNCTWYTNIDHVKRHEELDLVCRYSPEEYPHYDNYDAIDVGKTADIPYDYDGAMGVPITFLDKYNPEQFEIIGQSLECADMNIIKSKLGKLNGGPRFYIRCENSLKRMYERIIIRNKHPRL